MWSNFVGQTVTMWIVGILSLIGIWGCYRLLCWQAVSRKAELEQEEAAGNRVNLILHNHWTRRDRLGRNINTYR